MKETFKPLQEEVKIKKHKDQEKRSKVFFWRVLDVKTRKWYVRQQEAEREERDKIR